MAVKQEVYFPILVAKNLDLQKMTYTQNFQRILNLEKAFVSDKSEPQLMKAVKVSSKKIGPCKHCGFPQESSLCNFKDLTHHKSKNKGYLRRVCTATRPETRKKPSKRKSWFVKAVKDPAEDEQSRSSFG